MYVSYYITDSNNNLVFQYLGNASAPTFQNLWIRIKNAFPEMIDDPYCLQKDIGKDLRVFKYHSKVNDITYWCLKSINPTGVQDTLVDEYVLMETLDHILLEYFDKSKLSLKKIGNNYDRLSMIFNYCLSGGEPDVSDALYSNRVRNAIPLQKDLMKFLNSTAKALSDVVTKHEDVATDAFFVRPESKWHSQHIGDNDIDDYGLIPWRMKIKHNSYQTQELYLDISERVQLSMKKTLRRKPRGSKRNNGHDQRLINCVISGSIDARALFNGVPSVRLQLDTSGNDLGVPRFHRCVQLKDYIADNDTTPKSNGSNGTIVKFVPPDGRFKLMEYSLRLDREYASNLGLLSANFENGLGFNGDEFEVTINISASTKVTEVRNLQVKLEFYNADTGVVSNQILETDGSRLSDTNVHAVSGIKSHGGDDVDGEDAEYEIKILRSTHGRFTGNIDKNEGHWAFDNAVPTGTIAILRGCVTTKKSGNDAGQDRNTSHSSTTESSRTPRMILGKINVSYEHEKQLVSGIKVSSIEVNDSSGNIIGHSIFKGVKYITNVVNYELHI